MSHDHAAPWRTAKSQVNGPKSNSGTVHVVDSVMQLSGHGKLARLRPSSLRCRALLGLDRPILATPTTTGYLPIYHRPVAPQQRRYPWPRQSLGNPTENALTIRHRQHRAAHQASRSVDHVYQIRSVTWFIRGALTY
jgi:hypothetical protein